MKLNPQQAPLYVSIILHAFPFPSTLHLFTSLRSACHFPQRLFQERASGTEVLFIRNGNHSIPVGKMDGVLM